MITYLYNKGLAMSKEERDIKVNEIIKTIEASDLPQIILDSFKDNFSKYFFNLNITNEELIKRATDCYEKNSILINKLPQDVATNFIYDYCTKFEEHKEIVESYTYYKGFKDIFYLLHGYGMSGVFIIFNGLSLKKIQINIFLIIAGDTLMLVILIY